MYRGIIQDRASTTVYLRDHIIARKLDQPTGLGRIYRVVHESTRLDTTAPFANATPAQLVEALSSPNGWRRDTAQRLLVERYARSVAPSLAKLAESATDYRTRLHALWTLDGIDSLEPTIVTKALSDSSRDVRASALRLSEKWLAKDLLTDEVLKRLDDPDWSVREQLAASLGAMPSPKRDGAMASLLERYANDPIVVDAALSGLRGSEGGVLDRMFASTTQTPQRETAITMLAGTIVRGGQDSAIQAMFKVLANDSRPEWQRSAVLRGAEVSVLGAPMPGSSAARRGGPPPGVTLPCPTCPGGRAGPGGAYAFERPAAAAAGGAGRGGGGTRLV